MKSCFCLLVPATGFEPATYSLRNRQIISYIISDYVGLLSRKPYIYA